MLTRCKSDELMGEFWEYPEGKRGPVESLEKCLRRELREEVGIEITEPVPFQIIRHAYPEKTVELHFFRCSIKDGHLRPLGCDALRWVPPEELTQVSLPPADRPLVDALISLRAAT